MKVFEFKAKIIKVDDMDAAYIEFPYDVEKIFNKKRVNVSVYFDSEYYEGILCRMKTEKHFIGIKKEIRKKINKQPGDIVNVKVWERKK